MTDLPHMFMVSFITNKRPNDDWTSNDYRFLLCAEWDTSRIMAGILSFARTRSTPTTLFTVTNPTRMSWTVCVPYRLAKHGLVLYRKQKVVE